MNPGDGAVTALAFHQAAAAGGPSHLLNGSSDGSISVWQVKFLEFSEWLTDMWYKIRLRIHARIWRLGRLPDDRWG